MAGSLSLSLSQQFDARGKPLAAGKLYFFQSGTTTPQSAYQDSALTIAHPNPIELDAAGRVPAFYLADGAIKIRLADSGGVTIIANDNLLVIGPSSGSGGSATVDATTVLSTGNIKLHYGTGTLSGFVRGNGRTIGSASSGASERANSDCQSLFEYLWTADANLSVSTGRGATANADWTANKTIALPDFRGRVLAAMDDMGNTAASRLTTAGSGIDGTTLGAAGGAETVTVAQANLPALTLPNTLAATTTVTVNVISSGAPGGAGNNVCGSTNGVLGGQVTPSSPTVISGSVTTGGSGTALNKMPPAIAITTYIKL
jgi:microcystin-dependent protein